MIAPWNFTTSAPIFTLIIKFFHIVFIFAKYFVLVDSFMLLLNWQIQLLSLPEEGRCCGKNQQQRPGKINKWQTFQLSLVEFSSSLCCSAYCIVQFVSAMMLLLFVFPYISIIVFVCVIVVSSACISMNFISQIQRYIRICSCCCPAIFFIPCARQIVALICFHSFASSIFICFLNIQIRLFSSSCFLFLLTPLSSSCSNCFD